MDNLGIVYTPVSNLKKTQSMEVGQVLPHHCPPASIPSHASVMVAKKSWHLFLVCV